MRLILKYLFLLLFLSLSIISTADDSFPINNLTVSFSLENHTLKGVSEIFLPKGQTATINLSGLKIISASVNGEKIITKPGAATMVFSPNTATDVLKIEYEAEFKSLPNINKSKNPGVINSNLINPEGIVLIDGWYPSIDSLSIYNLTATLPNDFDGISEAEEIRIKKKTDNTREFFFTFHHPLAKISLIAGKYVIEKDRYNEIDIFTYFFSEDKGLARSYIEYTKKYLNMYEKLIGRYPFKRFSIVENLLPTGYAMPTFTLLGQEVVKLPFIVETSLGHEILHQWFGNLVYIDYKKGNWAEGLTTYLADHMYEELKGVGWDYRKQALVSFQSYVTPENDFPLCSFSNKTDKASEGVGYGKCTMVFHMLKNLVGEKLFYNSLQAFIEKNKFSTASWDKIMEAFESTSGKNLDWFFKQWLEEKGILDIELRNMSLQYRGSKVIISFEILQKGKNYKISLPVSLKLKDGEIRKIFEIEKELTALEIEAYSLPVELVIDDNYDLFRKLSDKEFPPVISRLLGDRNKIFVIPQHKNQEYAVTSEFFKKEGFIEKKEEEIKYDDIKESSLIISGIETDIVKRLFGKIEKQHGDFYLITRGNPFSNKSVIAVFDCKSPSETSKYIKKITHYGKYSNIAFKDGKNISKKINNSERGMRRKIAEDIIGVEIPRTVTISDVIEKVSNKSIVYVGESHTSFEHHRVQLEIIKELHRKNKNIAIAMEMFQKPFQKVLDDYITGIIDEKSFLKKSEYFKRWGFDYNLYREILLYAREYKIPVIALNVSREIVSKVSKGGIYSLRKEELKEIPEDMDLSDKEYKEWLRKSFEKHKNPENKNFDFFYEAQVLWDESMAHNLNEFIQKNPEHQIIVIAGVGHVAFGYGIPRRAYRLNKKEYSIILNNEGIEKHIADFVLFPPQVTSPESPKLMVKLKKEGGKVKITDFLPDSISKKAGLKKNDIILSLDNTKIDEIDDIKISLIDKKKGDDVIIKVLRKGFLFGTAEKEFKLKL